LLIFVPPSQSPQATAFEIDVEASEPPRMTILLALRGKTPRQRLDPVWQLNADASAQVLGHEFLPSEHRSQSHFPLPVYPIQKPAAFACSSLRASTLSFLTDGL
jgi:hypothetical protein